MPVATANWLAYEQSWELITEQGSEYITTTLTPADVQSRQGLAFLYELHSLTHLLDDFRGDLEVYDQGRLLNSFAVTIPLTEYVEEINRQVWKIYEHPARNKEFSGDDSFAGSVWGEGSLNYQDSSEYQHGRNTPEWDLPIIAELGLWDFSLQGTALETGETVPIWGLTTGSDSPVGYLQYTTLQPKTVNDIQWLF